MQAYIKAIELLIDLASLQTAFLTLDQAIKATNRRVNALDNVVKPRLETTIAYIKACTLSACTPHHLRTRLHRNLLLNPMQPILPGMGAQCMPMPGTYIFLC